MARAADRAYDAGMHLQAIREQRLFETFERADLAFGVSKLRLLVQAKFANPRALVLEGIPGDGGPSRSVESFTYREFVAWVKVQPASGPLIDAIGTALEVLLGVPTPIEQEAA